MKSEGQKSDDKLGKKPETPGKDWNVFLLGALGLLALLAPFIARAQADVPDSHVRAPTTVENLAASLDNWLVEKWEDKAVHVEAQAGELRVETQSPEHGVMIWLKRELPRDFIFEYDFTPRSKTGFFLLFFCAKGAEGQDVLSKDVQEDHKAKTLFNKYVAGKIRSYHISYRRGEEANCNLRKNPGLNLLKQEKLGQVLPQGKTVHVKLTRKGGRILLEVGGAAFMDYTDKDGPLEGGRLALRQVYDSAATYTNVTLRELPRD